MPNTPMPDYKLPIVTFLPWVRQGMVALAAPDVARAKVEDGRLALSVRLQINQEPELVDAPIRLYGPGDVTGIDPREVVRTEPPHLTADFDPSYFPAVEFDLPDFPWLFTPAAPDGRKRVRPWLCLVVVPKRADVTLEAAEPLPVLTCRRGDLPDLADAWQWAHAQVAWTPPVDRATGQPTVTREQVDQVMRQLPDRSISRLLHLPPLRSNQGYYACVVPTYRIGVQAGLGEAIEPADERNAAALADAWPALAQGASEADRGRAVRLPVYYHWEFATGSATNFETLVRRLRPQALDPSVGKTEMDLGDAGWGMPPAAPVVLEGALRAKADGRPLVPRLPVTRPAPVVTTAFTTKLEQLLTRASTDGDRLVLPPIYGATHAGGADPLAANSDRPWLRELNLDPRYRVAAGLGSLVVRYEQEQLMAAAWDQAAELQKRQRAAAQRELAEQLSVVLTAKLSRLPAERVAQVTEPGFTGASAPGAAAQEALDESSLPNNALSPAFRRLTRPQGPILRRLHEQDGDGGGPIRDGTLLRQIATRAATATRGTLAAPGPQPAVRAATRELPAGLSAARMFDAGNVRTLLFNAVRRVEGGPAPVVPTPAGPASDIEPLPKFTTPMYEALRDYFPELFLPGMEHVQPNTVALLETNSAFIEAFMVGLNHEMSRELLWREFSTDLRGTYFRHFWDSLGAAPDIPPIDQWKGALGKNSGGPLPGGRFVLLIRGDLLRRFPAATIYAVGGEVRDGKPGLPEGGKPELPLFRGTKAPDVTFLAFQLAGDPRGDLHAGGSNPGYFFVIQEQPTEARFGWSPADTASREVDNSAALAHRTLRRPFRVAIHARAILP